MTNLEAKQVAIKKAFNECGYTELLPLNVNGWVKCKPGQYENDLFERIKLNANLHSIRPKSLKNLDSNNGWIRIEPDGSNLPQEGVYDIFSLWGKIVNGIQRNGNDDEWWIEHCSHYKPIKEELKPIY